MLCCHLDMTKSFLQTTPEGSFSGATQSGAPANDSSLTRESLNGDRGALDAHSRVACETFRSTPLAHRLSEARSLAW